MIDKQTGMSTKERMGEEIATLAARIDAATYELLVLIRKFDEEEGWSCGFLTCAHWLTWRIGLAPGAARERVRVARALGDLPLISEAMRRGELSYSKVRALTRIATPDTEQSLVVGKVRADALALVAESALKGGLDPGSSGDRYQVVVHVNGEELTAQQSATADNRTHVPAGTSRAGVPAGTPALPGAVNGAWLGNSHVPVSAETARRIACDAGSVSMTHRNGQVLSVGRKTRTIPPPIRRALEFRDQGCRFPGCTSQHCDAHHIVHWADGGETKLSNLVLLCRRHHRLLHEGGFSVKMNEERAVQFLDKRGRPLEHSPAPPPVGSYPARELIRQLEDAGILITGKESMPAWDGTPMDLPYVMECLWRPPPHLEAAVARERNTSHAA